jgi:hypothetical protein
MCIIKKISIYKNRIVISDDQHQVFNPSVENAIVDWTVWTDAPTQLDNLPYQEIIDSSEVCEIEQINDNTLQIDVIYSDLCFEIIGQKIETTERPYNRDELIEMINKLSARNTKEAQEKLKHKNKISSAIKYIENELHKCKIIIENKPENELASKKAFIKKECLLSIKNKLL